MTRRIQMFLSVMTFEHAVEWMWELYPGMASSLSRTLQQRGLQLAPEASIRRRTGLPSSSTTAFETNPEQCHHRNSIKTYGNKIGRFRECTRCGNRWFCRSSAETTWQVIDPRPAPGAKAPAVPSALRAPPASSSRSSAGSQPASRTPAYSTSATPSSTFPWEALNLDQQTLSSVLEVIRASQVPEVVVVEEEDDMSDSSISTVNSVTLDLPRP